MFTADVAVEDRDETAQDSSHMLAHSQGTFCRVADFRIDTTAPAVGLGIVPNKRQNYVTCHTRIIWYDMLGFCLTNPKNQKNDHDLFLYLRVQQ